MKNLPSPNETSSAAQKRAHLAQLLQEKVASKPFLLSSAQERLWFLDRWQPHSAAYNICRGVRLRGALDIGALHHSLSAVVARHEALRTIFSDVNGQPRQRIVPPTAVELPLIDVNTEARTVDQIITTEAQRPFDLTTGPLLRVILLRLYDEDHILLLVVHHIVADGWSMRIFFREIAHLYAGDVAKSPVSLPDLSIQYVDYAVWQRAWLQSEVSASHLAYWQQQLAPPRPILDLPTDQPRPAIRTDHGTRYTFALPPDLYAKLKALSHDEGVTLFMTLLAAFKVLLYRYTGQTDILIGTPVANRNRQEVEGLIGFFVNTLVLRSDLSREPTFQALLKRMRQMTTAAYAHQAFPFERLVAELQPERDPSRTPLFQVMFAFQPDPTATLNLPGITVEPLAVDNGTAKFDLSLYVDETAAGLHGVFEYATDLFAEATIARMAGHWQTLLTAAAADSTQPITTLPLLTPAERAQFVTWNETRLDYPDELGLHQLFEAQATRTPEAIAVRFEGESLTYARLNQRANQLAAHLRTLNIGSDVLVGIYMERSLEMMVALLGILKAGGAYVPLDPTYPRERLAFMVQDAQLPLLLTQQRLVDKLPPHEGQVLCLDADWPAVAQQSEENLPSLTAPHHLAYVIYTSGSTGQPKGVQIPHQAVVNFLTTMAHQPGLQAEDRLLAVTTLSFDIAVLELFLPLTVGAQVILVSRQIAADGRRLADLIEAADITVMQATPATWRLLLAAEWAGRPGLKMLCGGEALPRALANELLNRGGALWNMYGPTETTIWSAIHPVEAGEAPVSIGRPIGNTQLYVLDDRWQPTPVGVPGQLYIGGDGLARGYLRRPELTADRFIPNPFSDDPAARLYKTGDLVYYRSDSSLGFLGRLDHQVKIRGFRIELGEIETTLRHHPDVNQAVVIAREETPGDQRLVAYYTAAQPLASATLRAFLSQSLPDYMLPAIFVHQERMPLTPNNKVDRQALPAPTFKQTTENYAPPSTPTEKTLAEMWTDLLNLEQVGIQDNFFEVGGHSLLATQLVSRIYKRFSVDLPLQEFFRTPTIAGLVKTLITREKVPGQIEKTAELHQKLNSMSPAQIRALLEAKKRS